MPCRPPCRPGAGTSSPRGRTSHFRQNQLVEQRRVVENPSGGSSNDRTSTRHSAVTTRAGWFDAAPPPRCRPRHRLNRRMPSFRKKPRTCQNASRLPVRDVGSVCAMGLFLPDTLFRLNPNPFNSVQVYETVFLPARTCSFSPAASSWAGRVTKAAKRRSKSKFDPGEPFRHRTHCQWRSCRFRI
jgi:hypothetical protein